MPNSTIIELKIDFGDFSAPVQARINRRAKRLIVRVDSVTGTVLITAPSKRALPEAMDFARTRAEWIRAELANGPHAKIFTEGGICPYQGIDHKIIRQGGPRTRIKIKETTELEQMPHLIVGGEAAHLNRRVIDWLKREARHCLTERSDFYCEKLNVRRGKIRIGDTRSRWGSCSEDGTLSYSWRLILAPPDILNYVAAHECTHLVHLDHSPAFWKLLLSLKVDAKSARDWFRQYGHDLFAYNA